MRPLTQYTVGQILLLRTLAVKPVNMTDAATLMGTSTAAATGMRDAFQNGGIIAETSHPHDRRMRLLCLTPAGEQTLAQIEGLLSPPIS